MITITKIFEFAAAHQLPFHEGLCKNLHGHQYRLEVEIFGLGNSSGPAQGMIMDFGRLKEIVNDHILEKHDHHYLNDLYTNPTAEIMVFEIADCLQNVIAEHNCELKRLRLWETPTSYAEWRA